jgi:hypothetical protein
MSIQSVEFLPDGVVAIGDHLQICTVSSEGSKRLEASSPQHPSSKSRISMNKCLFETQIERDSVLCPI